MKKENSIEFLITSLELIGIKHLLTDDILEEAKSRFKENITYSYVLGMHDCINFDIDINCIDNVEYYTDKFIKETVNHQKHE